MSLFEREMPIGRHSPAEKRLAAVGIEFRCRDDEGAPPVYEFTDCAGNFVWLTVQQAEAIAAHMREREGGESDE